MSLSEITADWKKRPVRLLAVDIGNTALKFGLFDLPGLVTRCVSSHSLASSESFVTSESLAPSVSVASPAPFYYPFSMVDIRITPKQLKILPVWLKTFSHDTPGSPERFLWVVSSVNQERTDEFCGFLRQKRPDDFFCLLNRTEIPLPNAYDHPDCLGIDRLLASFAASRFFSRPGPVLIVDIGTATKIDLVDASRTFRGGVIFPGPETQLRSLYEKTDRLPELHWSPAGAKVDYPATETEQGIRLGVAGGLFGAILYFYDRARRVVGDDSLPLLLTGGGAIGVEPLLEPLLHDRFMAETASGIRRVYTVRDLVLSGIALSVWGKISLPQETVF